MAIGATPKAYSSIERESALGMETMGDKRGDRPAMTEEMTETEEKEALNKLRARLGPSPIPKLGANYTQESGFDISEDQLLQSSPHRVPEISSAVDKNNEEGVQPDEKKREVVEDPKQEETEII